MNISKILFITSLGFLVFSIAWPLIPEVDYSLFRAKALISQSFSRTATDKRAFKEEIPQENRLVIPAINVDSMIVEGLTEEALNKGVWRRPISSTPDTPGNTVLTGHRFLYTGFSNNTFYNLDKLKIGDLIYVYWQATKHKYSVSETKIVDPTAIEIEGDYGDRRLTLYTCHPLWTADKRLVVVAKPSVE